MATEIKIVNGPSREELFDALRLGRQYRELGSVSFLMEHEVDRKEPVTAHITDIAVVGEGHDWLIYGTHPQKLWTAEIKFNTVKRDGTIRFIYPS
ncbi:MAG: hypothetical protein WC348_04495 [Patescibacteria group bacterium]